MTIPETNEAITKLMKLNEQATYERWKEEAFLFALLVVSFLAGGGLGYAICASGMLAL